MNFISLLSGLLLLLTSTSCRQLVSFQEKAKEQADFLEENVIGSLITGLAKAEDLFTVSMCCSFGKKLNQSRKFWL